MPACSIAVGDKGGGASARVAQSLLFVGREDGKLLAVRQLVSSGGLTPPALVFVQSKERAVQLTKALQLEGIHADAIHADKTAEEVRVLPCGGARPCRCVLR